MAFKSPLYPVPTGTVLGSVPSSRFSGEPTSGPLSGSNGSVFFSPSLLQQNNTNEIDLDEMSVAAVSEDVYSRPEEKESRVFTFGPYGSSRTNSSLYKVQPKHYAAVAVLVQTIPPGPTTVVNVP